MSEFKVGLRQEIGGKHGEQVRAALLDALGGAPATTPDETGTFDVTVEAETIDAALLKVWDAIATAGVDDHILFIEHPNVPEHWRWVPR
jgi:hypothetical protein